MEPDTPTQHSSITTPTFKLRLMLWTTTSVYCRRKMRIWLKN